MFLFHHGIVVSALHLEARDIGKPEREPSVHGGGILALKPERYKSHGRVTTHAGSTCLDDVALQVR
jgi:hypothetical protein